MVLVFLLEEPCFAPRLEEPVTVNVVVLLPYVHLVKVNYFGLDLVMESIHLALRHQEPPNFQVQVLQVQLSAVVCPRDLAFQVVVAEVGPRDHALQVVAVETTVMQSTKLQKEQPDMVLVLLLEALSFAPWPEEPVTVTAVVLQA